MSSIAASKDAAFPCTCEELVPQVQRWLDNGVLCRNCSTRPHRAMSKTLKRERDKASKKSGGLKRAENCEAANSFADWELLQQGILLEPLLQGICDFLDDHEEMIEAVRRDLERGLKNPGTGRNGLTPQQVLRSLILKRVKKLGFSRNCANGSLTATRCVSSRISTASRCRSTVLFNRAFNRLTPNAAASLQAVNELSCKRQWDLGLQDGQKLRVDSPS